MPRRTTSTTGRNGIPKATIQALEAVNGAKMLSCVARGMTIREASEELGVGEDQGRKIYHRELSRVHESNKELAELLIPLNLETIRLLVQAHMPIALAGHVSSAKLVLDAIRDRAKLLGLEAAIKVEVSNQRIEEAVGGIITLIDSHDQPVTLLEAETG
jgi:hypothetical protein